MQKLLKYFKFILRPANIFLITAIIIVFLNSLFILRLTERQEQINNLDLRLEILIIYKESQSLFSNRYVGVNGGKVYHIDTSVAGLEGNTISFLGGFKSYTLNGAGFEKYYKTRGVQGVYKVDEINSISCNVLCHSIKGVGKIKLIYIDRFNYSFCFDFYSTIFSRFKNYDCKLFSDLSKGLLFGEVDGLSDEFKEKTKSIGIYHIFSFSGFQIVLIFSWLEYIFGKILITNKKASTILIIAFIFIFIVNIGFEMPVLRSAVSISMQSLVLIFLGRRLSTIRSLMYSAIIFAFVNPIVIFNLSFQLSFLATLGVSTAAYINKKINHLNSISRYLLSSFLPTIISTLFTFPIINSINSIKIDVFTAVFSNFVFNLILPLTTVLLILSPISFIGDLAQFLVIALYLLLRLYIDLT